MTLSILCAVSVLDNFELSPEKDDRLGMLFCPCAAVIRFTCELTRAATFWFHLDLLKDDTTSDIVSVLSLAVHENRHRSVTFPEVVVVPFAVDFCGDASSSRGIGVSFWASSTTFGS
jgi:hypothetical protein